MNTHTDTLEAELERERESLARTFGKLQDRVSIETLAEEALGAIKTNAAAYTRSIDTAVRANPMAFALTGVGIAWLIFGARRNSGNDTRSLAEDRWLDEGGALDPLEDGPRGGSQVPHTDDVWATEADRIRREASASLNRIEHESRSAIGGAYAAARDFTAERAEVVANFTADLKKSFLHGLDDLSEAARERIVSLRQGAYAASLRAERMAKRTTREAGRLFDEHPLVAGAAAVAAGAALAAFLPRTRTEDEAFGAERDRLMREASALLRDERKRAERVAKGVGEELKAAAYTLGETVSDEIADTAEAVKTRARQEASGSVKGSGSKPAAAKIAH